ncbi:hypothetical protein [Klebsiella pneumoniae]|uniref:endonuclease III domain-containing protein n=1 Tax=Klebsiella pneumoniae TaxID=573 RepID=UPI00294A2BE4|nr:hypothetical protein [Klebsiella pneumoniae]MDV5727784.1 hypothetical protein [Klebsiella pneumoniae]
MVNAANKPETRFHGRVPRSVEKLIEIPGVGLKTANVYLNSMYQANQGVGADTHVMRVSRRLGFTDSRDPRKVAIALQKLYPKKDWYRVTALFVLYGRYYCKARVKPENSKCIFKEFCTTVVVWILIARRGVLEFAFVEAEVTHARLTYYTPQRKIFSTLKLQSRYDKIHLVS